MVANPGIPIATVHRGHSHILDCCLFQAFHSNPTSPIYLIGDSSNNIYPFVKHINIDELSERSSAFEKLYVHCSVNTHQFELFCLQRWFLLEAWMERFHIERCLHIDSDVLVFANMTEESSRFDDYDLTLSRRVSPHSCFINNRSVLSKFAAFIENFYTDQGPESLFKKLEQLHISTNGKANVCDMTLFEEFLKLTPVRLGETAQILSNSFFDTIVPASDGFEVDGKGFKKVEWFRGIPFGKTLSNKKVRFCTLHFQGGAKPFIWNYYAPGKIFIEPFEQKERKRFSDSISQQTDSPILSLLVTFDETQSSAKNFSQALLKQTIPLDKIQVFILSKSELPQNIKNDLSISHFHRSSNISFIEEPGLKERLLSDLSAPYTLCLSSHLLPEPSCLESHLQLHDCHPNALARGIVELSLLQNPRILSLALRTVRATMPYIALDTFTMPAFQFFNLTHTSLPTTALKNSLARVPLGLTSDLMELELAYDLWCQGLRIVPLSRTIAVDNRSMSIQKLGQEQVAWGKILGGFLKEHKETTTHFMGWHECSREDLLLICEELKVAEMLPLMVEKLEDEVHAKKTLTDPPESEINELALKLSDFFSVLLNMGLVEGL